LVGTDFNGMITQMTWYVMNRVMAKIIYGSDIVTVNSAEVMK
jgi:hypothetical protein